MADISHTRAADGGKDQGEALWRRWRAAIGAWSPVQSELDNVEIGIRANVPAIEVDGRKIALADDIDRLWQKDWKAGTARPAGFYDDLRRRLEARNRAIGQRSKGAAVAALEARAEALREAWCDLEDEILRLSSPSPATIAAKLHVCMDRSVLDDPEDHESLLYTGILRDLLPLLPADMAAVIDSDLSRVAALQRAEANRVRGSAGEGARPGA